MQRQRGGPAADERGRHRLAAEAHADAARAAPPPRARPSPTARASSTRASRRSARGEGRAAPSPQHGAAAAASRPPPAPSTPRQSKGRRRRRPRAARAHHGQSRARQPVGPRVAQQRAAVDHHAQWQSGRAAGVADVRERRGRRRRLGQRRRMPVGGDERVNVDGQRRQRRRRLVRRAASRVQREPHADLGDHVRRARGRQARLEQQEGAAARERRAHAQHERRALLNAHDHRAAVGLLADQSAEPQRGALQVVERQRPRRCAGEILERGIHAAKGEARAGRRRRFPTPPRTRRRCQTATPLTPPFSRRASPCAPPSRTRAALRDTVAGASNLSGDVRRDGAVARRKRPVRLHARAWYLATRFGRRACVAASVSRARLASSRKRSPSPPRLASCARSDLRASTQPRSAPSARLARRAHPRVGRASARLSIARHPATLLREAMPTSRTPYSASAAATHSHGSHSQAAPAAAVRRVMSAPRHALATWRLSPCSPT